jgi:hypothetical protein
MTSFANRSLTVLAVAGVAVTMAAAPALAVDNSFELGVGRTSAYGTYDRMMSFPERPVPPFGVRGTLAVNQPMRCAVVQIAYNGPTDAIAWRTLASLCHRGRTDFRAQSGQLWGGAAPPVRLCAGITVKRAEQGRACDVFTPPADL